MMLPVRRGVLACVVPLLAATPASVKDAIGVYGVVDRVVFEPDAARPERVQLWGVFAISHSFVVENGRVVSVDLSAFHPTRRGYLYYTLNPLDTALSRAEWTALRDKAGSGEVVAFGSRIPVSPPGVKEPASVMIQRALHYNGRVRRAGEAPAQPDTFPLRMPNTTSRGTAIGRVLNELRRVAEPLQPTDGAVVPAGALELIVRNAPDADLRYVFELERADGVKHTSEPVPAGVERTSWRPPVRLAPGESYTWRVRALSAGVGTFPPAEAAFRVKS